MIAVFSSVTTARLEKQRVNEKLQNRAPPREKAGVLKMTQVQKMFFVSRDIRALVGRGNVLS